MEGGVGAVMSISNSSVAESVLSFLDFFFFLSGSSVVVSRFRFFFSFLSGDDGVASIAGVEVVSFVFFFFSFLLDSSDDFFFFFGLSTSIVSVQEAVKIFHFSKLEILFSEWLNDFLPRWNL